VFKKDDQKLDLLDVNVADAFTEVLTSVPGRMMVETT
jgi:hypothetical protein